MTECELDQLADLIVSRLQPGADAVRCVTEQEAAELLAVSVDALRDRRRAGEIRHVRVGRVVRYRLKDLQEFLECTN